MRENRPSGSEGGGTETNQFLLPLSTVKRFGFSIRPEIYSRIFRAASYHWNTGDS